MEDNQELKTIIANEPKKSGWQSFRELIVFAVISLAIVVPIRMFVAQPFIVSGSSMFPTFENGQYLVVDELSYRIGAPQRDDVVVFKYPNDTTKFFIKRIIGLPGETIDIRGSVITITNKAHPEGFVLDQPFIKDPTLTDNIHFVTKDNEYFVMGDNRNASSDSRFWGAVPSKLLIGRVFLRLFPVTHLGVLPGNYKQQ